MAQQHKGGYVWSSLQKSANCNPVGGYAANQALSALLATPKQRIFPQFSHKPANFNAVQVDAAPEFIPAAPDFHNYLTKGTMGVH